jgi:hypothetical protein
MICHAMQCILYKIYFWKVFHMHYNLTCIFLYALLFAQNFILVKSGCYTRLDMRRFSTRGHPLKTVMTAFSSRNGAVSLLSGPLSGLAPQVMHPKVMKLHIMPQSLCFCLMG